MLVNGLINMTVGWIMAAYIMMFGGMMCTGLLTLGTCPFGVVCGAFPMLMVPLAVLEIVTGILVLADPKGSRPMMRWLPLVQIPALLIGDLVSPVVGLVAFMSSKDPEVIEFMDGRPLLFSRE